MHSCDITVTVGFYKSFSWHLRRNRDQKVLLSIVWNFLETERNRTWKHTRNEKAEKVEDQSKYAFRKLRK